MNNLQKLAAGLARLAVEKSETPTNALDDRIVRHTLPKGLRIAISYRGGEWSVGFWRINTVPSPVEIQVLKRDFNIPAEALASGERMRRVSATEVWRGYVFSWHGPKEFAVQETLLEH